MGNLTIELSGRIDGSNSEETGARIFEELKKEHDSLIFDAQKLEYISSTGLRVLLKAIKQEEANGNSRVVILNVSSEVYEIFEMTGFDSMMDVKKAYRSISVDGCEVIGKGFFGTVYRIDEETIVKVYKGKDSIPRIENEKKMAKAAFVKGIPTAISYDIVKVGEDYGSVFEMLKAKPLNDMIRDNDKDRDTLIREYVELLKQIHSTKMDEGVLPEAKNVFLDSLYELKDILSVTQIGNIRKLIVLLPQDMSMVHGDIQMRNVMICDGEPMIIDMDTLATGGPIFDLQGLYVTYKIFKEDEPDNSEKFLGISGELSDYIWDKVMEYYFETDDREVLDRIEDKIRVLAYVRFLYIIYTSDLKEGELGRLRIEHSKEHIDELLERVEDLEF
ncbi:MAG: anti-sigma factor antagonist [Lachnospiraceae bacterium]|nr:anti-sigma factor antagonist [Lachnospiraceae bacterium]